MKILIITQRYSPENFRISDIAESLKKEGNFLTVLTGLPNYPQGYIYDGYKHGEHRDEYYNDVHIIRVKEIARRHNILFRFLNYWSFAYYGKKMAKKLKGDFDVVLINGLSPIMSALPGIEYAEKNKKPILMYEMDLWPESLLAGGIKKNSFIYNHYKRVSSSVYSKMNKILVSTKEHMDYIKKLPNCSNLDIFCLPQYAEEIFENSNIPSIENGIIDLMFAGNIGKAQSIHTIIEAAHLLKDNKNIVFHIVGDGSELNNAKKLTESYGLTNIIFYGQRPLTDMPKLYSLADAMLLTLEDKEYANMTIPGKVQSYMASYKAIIASVNGASSSFIKENNLGYVCDAGDYKSLASLINNLDIDSLKEIGKHSYDVYMKKYHKDIFMKTLIDNLEKLVSD